MRKMILTGLASLAMVPAAFGIAVAQTQPPAAQPPAAAPAQPPAAAPGQPPVQAPAASITAVRIVEMSALPAETREQVESVVAERSEADAETLRSSLDGTPQVAEALQAEGVSSDEIVVASLAADGTLTLLKD